MAEEFVAEPIVREGEIDRGRGALTKGHALEAPTVEGAVGLKANPRRSGPITGEKKRIGIGRRLAGERQDQLQFGIEGEGLGAGVGGARIVECGEPVAA